MRSLMFRVVVILAASVLAGCSGGGEADPTSSPHQFVSSSEALAVSAERFQEEVHSFKGKMDIFSGSGDDTFEITSEMEFREPDSFYMKMELPKDGELEALLIGRDYYFGYDGDWARVDLSSASAFNQYDRYKENKGPVSYSDVVAGLQGLMQLPNETIDGQEYWHYQGTVDPGKEIAELPDDALTPEVRAAASSICAASFDVVIDPETLLPRRYIMNMGFRVEGKTISMLMTMEFLEYNVDVDIPGAPANATQFAFPATTPPHIDTTESPANSAVPCEVTTPTAVSSTTPIPIPAAG